MNARIFRFSVLSAFVAIFVSAAFPRQAGAISIDEFTGQTSLAASPGAQVAKGQVADSGVIGGNRFVQISYVAPSGSGIVSVQIDPVLDPGKYKHSQDVGDVGRSFVVWDGTPNASKNPLNPAMGLGNIDLLVDGGTKFEFEDFAADLAGGFITMRVHETVDAFSEAVIPIPVGNSTPLEVPFSAFVAGPLSTGPANFAKVNAIVLIVNSGSSGQASIASLDVKFSKLSTDGECVHVPVNGAIYDQCNVCNGNGQSCLDCLGVPFGTTLPGANCPTGDVGVCADGTYGGTAPNCSCDMKTPPSTEICDNLDNDCDGEVDEIFDVCGVQCGDGTSCLDCAGMPNGGAKVDQCGVCGGDNSSCSDCAGTPNGGAKVDQCGVCGGNNSSCSDCAGTPNGSAKVDQCGVCGGDNSSCSDCAGTPNGSAKLDQCGVCAGDGTSCTQCTEKDISQDQFAMDAAAKKQEKVIKKGIRLLSQLGLDSKTKKQIQSWGKRAHALQIRNWIISWTLPQVITTCPNVVVCVVQSHQPLLDEYFTHAKELLDINAKIVSLLKKKKQPGRARTIERSGTAVYNDGVNLAATVPVATQVCSKP